MYYLLPNESCIRQNRLTKRAPDKWDSARFTSLFLTSGLYSPQAESPPTHLRVTQTVRRQEDWHYKIGLMNYYKYQDKFSPLDGGVTYIEIVEGIVYRQITVNGEKYLMSNINYPEWGLMMAEGEIDYSDIDEVQEISKEEFDAIWNAHLSHRQVQWDKTKQKVKSGSTVTGYIQIFYPQGVIVNLGEDILGVANYADCKANAKPEWMYPGFRVTAVVADYDELNHWLVLEKPRVYSERLKDYRVSL